MNPDRPKKATVTVEDLLRLKRAERPPEDFWADFDRNLRAKQLAAIVEPRPWWAPLIRVGARVSRYQLPVGAAAILALSLVSIREFRDSTPVSESEAVAVVSQVSSPATGSLAQTGGIAAASPAPVIQTAAVRVESSPTNSRQTETGPAVESPRRALPSAAAVVLGDGFGRDRAAASSVRFVAANLTATEDTGIEITEPFAPTTRAVAARQPVREPLAQVSSPAEARLARLLSSSLSGSSVSSDTVLRGSERVARSLTEDRLYDSVSRVNARGAGVLVRF